MICKKEESWNFFPILATEVKTDDIWRHVSSLCQHGVRQVPGPNMQGNSWIINEAQLRKSCKTPDGEAVKRNHVKMPSPAEDQKSRCCLCICMLQRLKTDGSEPLTFPEAGVRFIQMSPHNENIVFLPSCCRLLTNPFQQKLRLFFFVFLLGICPNLVTKEGYPFSPFWEQINIGNLSFPHVLLEKQVIGIDTWSFFVFSLK